MHTRTLWRGVPSGRGLFPQRLRIFIQVQLGRLRLRLSTLPVEQDAAVRPHCSWVVVLGALTG